VVEEMILLSKVIKSRSTSDVNDTYVIGVKKINNINPSEESSAIQQIYDEEFQRLETMKKEVEIYAETLRCEAESMYHNTIDEINALKSEWEFEKEELIRISNESGYNDGFRQGLIDGKASLKDKFLEVDEIINLAKTDYEKRIIDSEETILQLAITISEKVLREKLSESEELFVKYIKNALKQMKDSEEIKVKVAPSNYKLLLSQKNELINILAENQSLLILPVEEMDEISCLIETITGQVDISIDTQLTELKNKLLELLHGDQ
jgi:flagellar assembly protein FliH